MNNVAIAKEVCNVYETGKFTIESCCKNKGISYESFNNWTRKNAEIKELYKRAKETKRKNQTEKLINLSKTALERKLSFEITTETRTEKDSTGAIIRVVETQKTIVPTATDILIALNNLDPDFKTKLLNNKQIKKLRWL